MASNPYPNKLPFDDIETLHECCNCEGCLCEDLCKKYDDEYISKGGDVKRYERTTKSTAKED